ncbi:MAG TPA: tRNA (N(6)-L-threonylcarbamoyladenosine(37)-C(2))-methylthiotransferase MtaB [Sedimentisphaerales bacterium]|nr:tRNA (N(6)-L-threonylcarbamoyladenosine(37)-C(2))-methylthiotransferase MtaB [Sedimentisphaerales bacterium]
MIESFSILTLGCKVNHYESQQIRQFLERAGLHHVDPAQSPQLLVVNSCTVTHAASAKSRHLLRVAQKQNPQTVVFCGCLPAVRTDELTALGENVHVVKDRRDLTALLGRLVAGSTTPDSNCPKHPETESIRPENDAKVKSKRDLALPSDLPELTSFPGQTRAFLKVQDGCDAGCSYCIIPTARPFVRFKNLDEIVSEATAFVVAGHKEIVLTGVHIGSYGQTTVRRRHWQTPENPHLPELLAKVAQIPGLARIRLSSLDPADVTTTLLDVFESHPNLMPNLHLSLQSGSDEILRRMARPYDADEFRAKVALTRSRLDRPAITTDIIVGFPGETDADFDRTLALAEEVAFARIHVFAFSPRKGTAAAKMQPRVPQDVVKARSETLRALDRDLQARFRRQFLGETAQVLVENYPGPPTGHAERYFFVRIGHKTDRTDRTNGTGPRLDASHESYESYRSYSPGTLLTVRLVQDAPNALLAEIA